MSVYALTLFPNIAAPVAVCMQYYVLLALVRCIYITLHANSSLLQIQCLLLSDVVPSFFSLRFTGREKLFFAISVKGWEMGHVIACKMASKV